MKRQKRPWVRKVPALPGEPWAPEGVFSYLYILQVRRF